MWLHCTTISENGSQSRIGFSSGPPAGHRLKLGTHQWGKYPTYSLERLRHLRLSGTAFIHLTFSVAQEKAGSPRDVQMPRE